MTPIIIAAIIVFALGVGMSALAVLRQHRTVQLKSRFGTEYDRTIVNSGGRRKAESELAAREKRVEKLDIRPLSEVQRHDYVERWRVLQVGFVDDPVTVVRDADRLVSNLMTARGYPMAAWEQRAADVSVDHALVVSNYRTAHGISQAMEAGKATTEQLRQAMVHYRTLFDELLTPELAGVR